ncbi:MAG: XdhC family protein [Marinicella sp.]
MLEQISPLWPIYQQKQQSRTPLVLATLVKTVGSSYKKAGAMMLIEQDRTTHGLLSGGCLEADVAEHALSVFESQTAIHIEYDLSDESIFGLGAGCDGTIHIVLQFLKDDYLPFSALNPLPNTSKPVELSIAHEANSRFPVGSYYVKVDEKIIESTPEFYTFAINQSSPLAYLPPPHVMIFGSGIDTIPLCQMLRLLHWHVTVVDHRSGRLDLVQDEFIQTLIADDRIQESIDSIEYNAAIIMTHNLEKDAHYLEVVANTACDFIGLLGPPARREKVLRMTHITETKFEQRLRAPVGLDLGGRMPENIAVAIAAQLQAYIYQT